MCSNNFTRYVFMIMFLLTTSPWRCTGDPCILNLGTSCSWWASCSSHLNRWEIAQRSALFFICLKCEKDYYACVLFCPVWGEFYVCVLCVLSLRIITCFCWMRCYNADDFMPCLGFKFEEEEEDYLPCVSLSAHMWRGLCALSFCVSWMWGRWYTL